MKITSLSPSQYPFSKSILSRFKRNKNQSENSSQQRRNSDFLPAITSIPSTLTVLHEIKDYKKAFDSEAGKMYDRAVEIAKQYKSPTVETKHLWLAGLMQTNDYLEEINNGETRYDPLNKRQGFLNMIIGSTTSDATFDINDSRTRSKFQNVIQNHIQTIQEEFQEEANNRQAFSSVPLPSKKLLKSMDEISEYMYSETQIATFPDSYFYLLGANAEDRNLKKYYYNLNLDMQKAMMIDDIADKKKHHLSFYDDRADAIWKSTDMGNDTIVLCDSENESSIKYLKSSFENLINKPDQHYRNLNPDNVEIINLNKFANLDFLSKVLPEINKRNKETGKTTVVVGDLVSLIKASGENAGGENTMMFSPGELDVIMNMDSNGKKNPYVRFVFTMAPDVYYANIKNTNTMSLGNMINDYATQTLPSITAQEAKDYLTDKKGVEYIENEIGKKVEPDTIKKVIELTNDDKGNYPDKVLNLLNRVSKYFVDSASVTTEQVMEYMREMQMLTETTNNDDNINIVYNTGKTLDDIAGSQITRETAQSVVNEIKNGTKTKGYLIYQANYTSDGGGRRNTAEAIAGEAGIPMITINAKEFLTKDLSTLYRDPDVAELKIKTLVSKVKAQAKTNPNKSAMIFIENFDNFATDEYKGYPTGSFEQKAFSQLLVEMEKARKEDGVNLVVMGSVNNRYVIDENIRKPGKFMDEIVVYPPQDDKERKEVINYYIKKMGLDIAGDEKQQEEIINHAAITSSHFSVVDIMYLLETANNVARERGKTEIEKSDITEAYLRTIYGRTNKRRESEHRKQIVTSHEAGHALTLQIMYNIASKQNAPWKLPSKVNFITLDPRGYYGGAMYPKDSENEEYSFEKVFADIVCDYGGHSSEKVLYGFTGSYGITADMEMAREVAEFAVANMGMGHKTGIRHIKRNVFGELDVSEKQKQSIEDDEEFLLSAAEKISDKVIEEYKGFIEEFTQKHWNQVGSGECIITSEEFNQELNDWIEKQNEEKRARLEFLNEQIETYTNNIKHGDTSAELHI